MYLHFLTLIIYLQLPLAHEPLAPQLTQPFVHPFAPYAFPPTRNIHVGSPHVKVDVQTARSNIEEPKYDKVSQKMNQDFH